MIAHSKSVCGIFLPQAAGCDLLGKVMIMSKCLNDISPTIYPLHQSALPNMAAFVVVVN